MVAENAEMEWMTQMRVKISISQEELVENRTDTDATASVMDKF